LAKIERFEEIKAWQLAKGLVTTIYRSSENGRFAKDYSLRDQIRRASVSVMSNIAEGFERGSDKDFQRFLYMAKGSAGEVRSHLFVANELGYLTAEEFIVLRGKAEDVSKSLSGFITYLYGESST
jgi:four helix bundle protein